MNAPRWPAVLLIVALLGAMVLVDRAGDDETPLSLADVARPDHPMPLAQPTGAALSSWYCPVAVSTPAAGEAPDGEERDPMVDRTVMLVSNVADEARSGRLELFGVDGSVAVEQIEVEAHSRWQLDLGRRTDDGPAAALLEFDGGGVAAVVLATGPQGSTVAPCSSQASPTWYFPTASTTLDARAVLQLFNPFPDDAILEITFYDGDGPRVPVGFEAFPVSGNSVVAVEVTDLVTVRNQLSASVQARSGQVVAAMVQSYDGTEGPEGLAVLPGAPQASDTWFFPAARWGESARETVVVFNPGEVEARIDVTVALDDPEVTGAVAPFERTVPSRGFVVLGSHEEEWSRVPPGVGHSISVRTQNDQPVVAAQRLTVVDGANAGVAVALGSPLVATEWIVPVVDLVDTVGSVTVLNPSPQTVSRLELVGVREGERVDLSPLELQPGVRAVVPVREQLDGPRAGALVGSSAPVVVSSAMAFTDTGGRAWWLAVPVAGTTVVPEAVEGIAGG